MMGNVMAGKDIGAVVAGHICLDITPRFGQVSGASVSEIFQPGKLLLIGGAEFSSGGPVSNTGLPLRRLGIHVALMGKCGQDPLGQILLDNLRTEAPGAEEGMRTVSGERTSYTVILVPPGIDRIFLHCPGANDTFGPEDIDINMVRRARLFHFGYPPIMARMYGSEGEELEQVLSNAASSGAMTSLDMALPDPNSPGGRAEWRTILAKALPHVDFFMPSLEEILFMLRRQRFDEVSRTNPDSLLDGVGADDVRGIADECIEMGARVVVIKCGHLGAYLCTAKELGRLDGMMAEAQAWRGRRIFEPTCVVETIVSATGSGDCAIAGFLAGVLQGEPPERCMKLLAAVGAQNLSAVSAVGGVKSWEETLADLDAGLTQNAVPARFAQLAAGQ